MFKYLFFLLQVPLLVWGGEVTGKNKAETKGMLLLDSISYSLVVDELKPEARVIIGIFDNEYTVAEDPLPRETEARFNYINFAVSYSRDQTADLSHLLFAQIVVNGGDNKYLKQRLVGDRQLPIFLVLGENKTNPIIIDLDVRDYRYCTFISILNNYAGYSNRLPGILVGFDEMVSRFMPASAEDRLKVIEEAKELYETVEEKQFISDADYYITTMQKVMEVGVQHLKEEGDQIITTARKSKVGDKSKYTLDKKMNILESFLNAHSDESIREADSVPEL